MWSYTQLLQSTVDYGVTRTIENNRASNCSSNYLSSKQIIIQINTTYDSARKIYCHFTSSSLFTFVALISIRSSSKSIYVQTSPSTFITPLMTLGWNRCCKSCFLLFRNRSGASNLAHETGTPLQSRRNPGGRFVTPGHPLAAQQPERDRAATLALEPGCARRQLEHHRLDQCTFGLLSTCPRPFQRLYPRLKLQPRPETAKSTSQRQRRRAR